MKAVHTKASLPRRAAVPPTEPGLQPLWLHRLGIGRVGGGCDPGHHSQWGTLGLTHGSSYVHASHGRWFGSQNGGHLGWTVWGRVGCHTQEGPSGTLPLEAATQGQTQPAPRARRLLSPSLGLTPVRSML